MKIEKYYKYNPKSNCNYFSFKNSKKHSKTSLYNTNEIAESTLVVYSFNTQPIT